MLSIFVARHGTSTLDSLTPPVFWKNKCAFWMMSVVNVLCRYLQTLHARGKSKESGKPTIISGSFAWDTLTTYFYISTLAEIWDSWDCWDEFGVYTF